MGIILMMSKRVRLGIGISYLAIALVLALLPLPLRGIKHQLLKCNGGRWVAGGFPGVRMDGSDFCRKGGILPRLELRGGMTEPKMGRLQHRQQHQHQQKQKQQKQQQQQPSPPPVVNLRGGAMDDDAEGEVEILTGRCSSGSSGDDHHDGESDLFFKNGGGLDMEDDDHDVDLDVDVNHGGGIGGGANDTRREGREGGGKEEGKGCANPKVEARRRRARERRQRQRLHAGRERELRRIHHLRGKIVPGVRVLAHFTAKGGAKSEAVRECVVTKMADDDGGGEGVVKLQLPSGLKQKVPLGWVQNIIASCGKEGDADTSIEVDGEVVPRGGGNGGRVGDGAVEKGKARVGEGEGCTEREAVVAARRREKRKHRRKARKARALAEAQEGRMAGKARRKAVAKEENEKRCGRG